MKPASTFKRFLGNMTDLGYWHVPRMHLRENFDDELIDQLLESAQDFAQLSALWDNRFCAAGTTGIGTRPYLWLARRYLELGNPLAALEVASAGFKHHHEALELGVVQGLALARSGAIEAANKLLTELASVADDGFPLESRLAEELYGLLARTHKDLGFQSPDSADRKRHFTKACRIYQKASDASAGYWTRLNVAATLVFAGERSSAVEHAQHAQNEASRLLALGAEPSPTERYWLHATLGEAALILGDLEAARSAYRAATTISESAQRWGDLATTRLQGSRLGQSLQIPQSLIDKLLPPPKVLVFAGSFPTEGKRFDEVPEAAFLAQTLKLALKGSAEQVCGAFGCLQSTLDLETSEVLLQQGIDLTVVLPCSVKAYVDYLNRAGWGDATAHRVSRILGLTGQIVIASPQTDSPSEADFAYARELAAGLGKVRAQQLLAKPCGWLSGPARHSIPDEITHAIGLWRSAEIAFEPILQLAELEPCPDLVTSTLQAKAFLFADFRGFSGLRQTEMESFNEFVLGGLAQLLARYADRGCRPLHANTWGDGLYFVFSEASDAAAFALDACEWVGSSHAERLSHGLPEALAMRVALHAGPAIEFLDPITSRVSYASTHVTYAARLEPATPPGLVYGSHAFAALTALQAGKGVECRYLGRLEWAKGSGAHHTYRVCRQTLT